MLKKDMNRFIKQLTIEKKLLTEIWLNLKLIVQT